MDDRPKIYSRHVISMPDGRERYAMVLGYSVDGRVKVKWLGTSETEWIPEEWVK